MKILVFSDSHGRLGHMMDAMERERPRRVFFLGDCYRDGEALRNAYPDVPMELVRGNCDWDQAPDELLVEATSEHPEFTRNDFRGERVARHKFAVVLRESLPFGDNARLVAPHHMRDFAL